MLLEKETFDELMEDHLEWESKIQSQTAKSKIRSTKKLSPSMKIQRICPNCQHTNIVELKSTDDKAYFTCKCGAVLPITEAGQNAVVATICPKCGKSFSIDMSENSARCPCGCLFNRMTGEVVESPNSKSITCGKCSRTFEVDSRSSVVICPCGACLYTAPSVQRVPSDVIRDQSTTSKPKAEPPQVKSNDSMFGDLGKLQIFYPRRAEELRSHARSGGKLSGPIEAVASSVWYLSQLWLVFLDGNDYGLTRDRSIYDQIVSLANTHPRCSIEHEAEAWMRAVAASLSNFEVSTALKCSVDTVGSILLLNGNFDDTYRMLVQGRMDPTSR